MTNSIMETALNDIDGINRALKEAELRTRVTRQVGEDGGWGNYATGRYVTSRGGHVLIKFYRYRWRENAQEQGRVCLKSVCRVIHKHRRAAMLVNGQAGTNTSEVGWWHEGDGPTVCCEVVEARA